VILVDSSVWIDYLRGVDSPKTRRLDDLLGQEPLAIGDLILAEVLQGIDGEREFNRVRRMLGALHLVTLGGEAVAVESARNFRRLRAQGITVRRTIDTVIATRCLMDDLALLHDDRDFDAFEQHLGLRVVEGVDAR
jgi:predicted nucleic acid-binding protein